MRIRPRRPGAALAEGFQFTCESESRSLDKAQYGSTVVTEAWVRRLAAELGIADIDCLARQLWTLDRRHGAPIARVRVQVDGQGVGNATLGLPRDDVAAYFGRDDCRAAGWRFHGPVRATPDSIVTVLLESRDGAVSCLASPLSLAVQA